jgi:hypothetical protein
MGDGVATFVEVRFDAAWTVTTKVLQGTGGSLDTIVTATPGPPALLSGVALARGVPDTTVDKLLTGLTAKYGMAPTVLRRQPGMCIFRYQFDAGKLEEPAMRVLLTFSEELGPPWMHIDEGGAVLRAEAADDAARVGAQVRKAMQEAKVKAPVTVERLRGADLAHWHEVTAALVRLQSTGAKDADAPR